MATCTADSGKCPRVVYARGLCSAHYRRWRLGQPTDQPIGGRGRPRLRSTCTECGGPHLAKGLCRRCYDAARRAGTLAEAAP